LQPCAGPCVLLNRTRRRTAWINPPVPIKSPASSTPLLP
jgi:hypothetical protein